ncbi:cell wall-binding repeat-containing protein [Rathayibacter sp. VKM Ac-2857]|uniref:cell wall-binding repeat-containing protein n=1 Tax=Rathayibacter sp. VKM Ac-2857 TaxID=2739020 RepID=UPI00156376D6|nr:cell wall-binding repeat-containing protein [Rathayibacter sp. VKM Ac-2857]
MRCQYHADVPAASAAHAVTPGSSMRSQLGRHISLVAGTIALMLPLGLGTVSPVAAGTPPGGVEIASNGVAQLDSAMFSEPSAASPLPEGARVTAASTAADAAISGSIVFEDASEGDLGPNGLPSGDFFVDVWNSDRRRIDEVRLTSSRFTLTGLERGAEYFLHFRPYGGQEWGAVWFGGSAVAVGAQPVAAPASNVTLTTTPPGAIRGSVSGLATNWSVQGVYRDPYTKRLFGIGTVEVVPNAEGEGSYVLTGLPRGTYTVLASAWSGGYDDRFWKDARRAHDATFFPVADRYVEGIDLAIPADEPWSWHTDRLSGSDRYATSVAISRSAFSPGVPVLYIASGANWPDALSAGPAAAARGGALLLTDPNSLTPVVADEIRRLAPRRIVVVGSDLTITPSTYETIARLAPVTERIGGRDRYETSRMLVAGVFDRDRREQDAMEVYIATGRNFPDALSASSVAAQSSSPVLLLDGESSTVDDATRGALSRTGSDTFTLVGGPTTISPAIEASLRSDFFSTRIDRVAGRDRYDTSARLFFQKTVQDTVYLASGTNFPDALAGVAAGAIRGSAVLLVEKDCVHQEALDAMKRTSKNYATLLGSPLTLTEDVATLQACPS